MVFLVTSKRMRALWYAVVAMSVADGVAAKTAFLPIQRNLKISHPSHRNTERRNYHGAFLNIFKAQDTSLNAIFSPIPGTTMPSSDGATAIEARISTTISTNTAADALSTQDVLVGIVLALLLAFLASFLQSQSPSSFRDFEEVKQMESQSNKEGDSFQDLDIPSNDTTPARLSLDNYVMNTTTRKKFNATNWQEMSQPENYVWYSNPKVRGNAIEGKKQSTSSNKNRGALIGLLLVFVPIFGAEIFLALSRFFVCEQSHSSGGFFAVLAQDWCAPV